MSTALATQDPKKAAVLARMRQMKEQGVHYQMVGGGTNYINFDGNNGNVAWGRDKTPLEYEDQRWVAPVENFFHGCKNWQGGKPVDEKRANIIEQPVAPAPPKGEPLVGELPKPRERDGWAIEMGFRLFGIGGKYDKVEFEFGSSAQGQKDAIGNLWASTYDHSATHYAEEGFINPVFRFEVDSYENKSYRRTIYVPKLILLDFTDGQNFLSDQYPNWNADEVGRDELIAALGLGEDDFDPMG